MNVGIFRAGVVYGVGGSALLALASSCARLDSNVNVKPEPIEVKPIEVKPIHLIVDVNIRVDRELDNFFDFEKRLDPDRADRTKPLTEAATQPATVPATLPTTTQPDAGASPAPAPPLPPPAGGNL